MLGNVHGNLNVQKVRTHLKLRFKVRLLVITINFKIRVRLNPTRLALGRYKKSKDRSLCCPKVSIKY